VVVGALFLCRSGLADVEHRFYGSVQGEYNSNVFDLKDRSEALAINGDKELSDTLVRYIAGIKLQGNVNPLVLRANLEGSRIDYSHFGRLDHNEYLLSGGLDWRLITILKGTVDYRQQRRMASFADRSSTALSIENEKTATATIDIDITPDWRSENGVRWRRDASALPNLPDFAVQESVIHTAIKYMANGHLTGGLYGELLLGRFDGVPDRSPYHEQTLALTADYAVPDFSRFGAQLGYTHRQDRSSLAGSSSNSASGMTGSMSYHRELTGKTAADAGIFRRVRSDVGNSSSVVETGAEVSATWRPTLDISVVGAYRYTQGRYQQPVILVNSARGKEARQIASLTATYAVLHWLDLSPYAGFQMRTSDIAVDSYQSFVGGLEIQAHIE
jgi:hypothetical protein